MQLNSNIKEFENLSVEKKTLSTALGFEFRSFDFRSTALTTELYMRPICPLHTRRKKFRIIYLVKSTGRSPVANVTLSKRCSPVESLVIFNVALTVEPTLNHLKMISCGNTRDCSFQFFCFPNYILVFKSKVLPISLWI